MFAELRGSESEPGLIWCKPGCTNEVLIILRELSMLFSIGLLERLCFARIFCYKILKNWPVRPKLNISGSPEELSWCGREVFYFWWCSLILCQTASFSKNAAPPTAQLPLPPQALEQNRVDYSPRILRSVIFRHNSENHPPRHLRPVSRRFTPRVILSRQRYGDQEDHATQSWTRTLTVSTFLNTIRINP